jgi:putative tricarboxylic transport membrane protein
MKVADLLAGAILVALGLAFAGYGWALPPMPGQRYGAGLFPMALGLCIAACGVQLAWVGWRERRMGPLLALAPWTRDKFLRRNFLVTLALILLYILLLDEIGFIPLSIVVLAVMFRQLDVSLGRSALIAVLATIAIYISFARWLRVPLPRGLLEGWIW